MKVLLDALPLWLWPLAALALGVVIGLPIVGLAYLAGFLTDLKYLMRRRGSVSSADNAATYTQRASALNQFEHGLD